MVTFTCSAVDLPATTLRWFFNDDEFARYTFSHGDQYPFAVQPRNATYNSLVGGVDVRMLRASHNEDMASFLSTMTLNISALQEARVYSAGCGSFTTRSTNNITYSNQGQV